MDFGLGILTFGTIGFMVAFGYLSVRATEKRRREGGPKSTLAADGQPSPRARIRLRCHPSGAWSSAAAPNPWPPAPRKPEATTNFSELSDRLAGGLTLATRAKRRLSSA